MEKPKTITPAMAEFAELLHLRGDDRDLREKALHELFAEVHLAASAMGFQTTHVVDGTERPHLNGRAVCTVSLQIGDQGFTATLRYLQKDDVLRVAQEIDAGMVQQNLPVKQVPTVRYAPALMRFYSASDKGAAGDVAKAIVGWFLAIKR